MIFRLSSWRNVVFDTTYSSYPRSSEGNFSRSRTSYTSYFEFSLYDHSDRISESVRLSAVMRSTLTSPLLRSLSRHDHPPIPLQEIRPYTFQSKKVNRYPYRLESK